MAKGTSRYNISLTGRYADLLERYATSRQNKPTSEAAYMLMRDLDELEEQGKIPDGDDQVIQNYLKMLASGTPVPDELIQLVAKEIGMDEAELRKVSDTCNAQANQRLSK